MRSFALCAFTCLIVSGCARPRSATYQGYLEGDFVYLASPLAGRLDHLAVTKGGQVGVGTLLFTLERSSEIAAQREAAERLLGAQARLEDLKKGARPSELATLEARLEQARIAAELSQLDRIRQENLFQHQVIPASDYDRARLTQERNDRAVNELSSQLATARLGARIDALTAAEADVNAAAAAKERADWSVNQKTQTAPRAGLVYDTLYREGEFVAASNPVVALLPPENIKVRFFVPEAEFSSLKAGDHVHVTWTGQATPMEATVSFLSPKPEFTPPVLYNRENRSKLVFMVEALFEGAMARDLHPGQPVDVAR